MSSDFAETKTATAWSTSESTDGRQPPSRVLHHRRLGEHEARRWLVRRDAANPCGNDQRRRRQYDVWKRTKTNEPAITAITNVESVLQRPADGSPVRTHLNLAALFPVDRAGAATLESSKKPSFSSRLGTTPGPSPSRRPRSSSSSVRKATPRKCDRRNIRHNPETGFARAALLAALSGTALAQEEAPASPAGAGRGSGHRGRLFEAINEGRLVAELRFGRRAGMPQAVAVRRP